LRVFRRPAPGKRPLRVMGLMGPFTITNRVDPDPVAEFGRFLRVLGPVEGASLWKNVGWLPYALGFGPSPPEGMDDVPITAWTLPG